MTEKEVIAYHQAEKKKKNEKIIKDELQKVEIATLLCNSLTLTQMKNLVTIVKYHPLLK